MKKRPGDGTGLEAPSLRWALTAVLVGLAYLGLSVLIWWHVWSTHPSTVTTCGCGDAALFEWFLEWPAYAIAHGQNIFYSTYQFHPAGINLLSNTSVLAVGVPLAPVTWLFGPIATINVASTLATPLAAGSMFFLLRHFAMRTGAAFVGGLIFGFGPFAFTQLAGGHLMSGVLAPWPLMVACLDELLVGRQRRPVLVGIALGLLTVVEFFVSTEMLTIFALSVAGGLVLLIAYGLATDREGVARRVPAAARGLGAGLVSAACLLAYPVWFALAGPAHLSGRVWPSLPAGAGGTHLASMVQPTLSSASLQTEMKVWGGYLGPRLPNPEFLGVGAVAVAVIAAVAWRRDRRQWLFVGVGASAAFVSLGLAVPWHVLGRVPLVQNIISGRFAAVTLLCTAVLVASAVDHAYESSSALAERRTRWPAPWRVVSCAAVSAAVAVAALAPMAAIEAPNIPMTTVQAEVPQWFRVVGAHLPPGQVLLTFPAPFTVVGSALAWQAIDRMRYEMIGGSGPEGVPSRAGKDRAGLVVLQRASVSLTGPPPLTAANIRAVHTALHDWGVTMIVVPDPAGLPTYDQGTNVASAIELFDRATGRRPHHEAGAWVWTRPFH